MRFGGDSRKGVLYLLLLRSHRRRVVVLRRRLHVTMYVGRRHVGRVGHGRDRGRAAVGLRRVGVGHAATLRLESRRHATALAVAELVVGRVAHLVIVVVVVIVVATAASALVVASVVVAVERVGRLTSEVSARLGGNSIGVGRTGALSHVALD